MANCIYCGGPANSVEHPLPAAFGEFVNAPLLSNRICRACNGSRLGVLDEQFARCGPEAVMRRVFRVEGRSTHEKINPHHRGSAGGGRLATKTYDSSIGCEVEIEFTGGREARQLCQIVFKEASGTTHHLPLPPTLTDPAKIREQFDNFGIADLTTTEVILVADPEERMQLEPILTAVWPKLKLGPNLPSANVLPGAITELRVTTRYFQAIAKIAFHYFLTQFADLDGSEACFAEIRSFITAPGEKLRTASKFIGRRQTPLLAEMLGGARPDGWFGHVLTAEVNGDRYLGHLQIFISEECPPTAYTVALAKGLGNVERSARGHLYRYYREGQKGKHLGEAIPLNAVLATPPRPLLPLFEMADSGE